MKQTILMVSAAALALLAGAPAMAMDTAKGTLFEVIPVPNSQYTNVFGINDTAPSGVITGSWTDASAVEHGYVGPIDGSAYVTFDDPNSPGPGTEPRGINDNGYITGFSNSRHSLSKNIPFERDPAGNITEITKGGAVLNDLIQGINNKKNEFVGAYIDSSLQSVGYRGESGAYQQDINLSGLANTGYAARGINDKGDIVGWYYDPSGIQHGFLIAKGTAQQLDPSEGNLAANVLEGINDRGTITGFWTDTSGLMHGYSYSMRHKKFHGIKVPGSVSFVQAWGISHSGAIAIGSDAGSYILFPRSHPVPARTRSVYKPLVRPTPQLP